jgi:L-asparagine transporter-like permease
MISVLRKIGRTAIKVLLIAVILTAASALYSTRLYVGRELWTSVVDHDAPMNTERVVVRGWPAAFLAHTPIGWRVTFGEIGIDFVLALPVATVLILLPKRSSQRPAG